MRKQPGDLQEIDFMDVRQGIPARDASLFLLGVGFGALVTWFLDPADGGRRRALIYQKGIRFKNDLSDIAARRGRNLRHRMSGVVARARGSEVHVDDHTLIQRVRSEFGRKVRHARSIDVDAREGVVTLRGPVLADEVDELLFCVRAVPGVRELVNELDIHQEPGNVPGLQGEGKEYLQ